MKYKTLTKGGSTYYRKLKTLIPIKGKYEKDFLNTILQNLESICSEQPAITYHELCTFIGTHQKILLLNIMKMRIQNMSFRNYVYLLLYVI
ncbi:MAG: DUF6120 family protein [Eubacterium ramulus]